MVKVRLSKIKAGFMFIELLLVTALIMFIAFKVFKLYFKPAVLAPETQQMAVEQNIDTTSYRTTIDSTRDRLQEIQDKHFEGLSKIEGAT